MYAPWERWIFSLVCVSQNSSKKSLFSLLVHNILRQREFIIFLGNGTNTKNNAANWCARYRTTLWSPLVWSWQRCSGTQHLFPFPQSKFSTCILKVLKNLQGWGENDRGVSFTFGPDVVSKFLNRHDMDLICRAHQVVEDGYEFFAKRQLVTLFSAPNYCGEFDNAGGMMSVDENLMCSFQVNTFPRKIYLIHCYYFYYQSWAKYFKYSSTFLSTSK